MRRGLRLEDTKKLTKFDNVRKLVAEEHDLKNSDVTIEMSKLRITPELHLEVPKVGVFNMTSWAKKQLGQILGIQWDKWFDPKLVDHTDIQSEIQKRFRKTNDTRKFRTKRFRRGAPGVDKADGYLRAVLSPTYHAIDDEKIFDRFERKFSSNLNEFGFMNDHFTKHSSWGNDHCNYYTLVTMEPVNLGPIDRNHVDPQVRHIYDLADREGKLPEADYVYPGMTMRNSEVGYTAVTIDEFSFRLVCLNGAIIAVGDSRLMYRQHRPIEDGELDRQLTSVFNSIPVRWENTRKNYGILHSIIVPEPTKEILHQLEKMEAPKAFQEAAVKAYELEPIATMYGVLQAITRAAQGTFEDMDRRFELETMAGRLVSMAPRIQLAA